MHVYQGRVQEEAQGAGTPSFQCCTLAIDNWESSGNEARRGAHNGSAALFLSVIQLSRNQAFDEEHGTSLAQLVKEQSHYILLFNRIIQILFSLQNFIANCIVVGHLAKASDN